MRSYPDYLLIAACIMLAPGCRNKAAPEATTDHASSAASSVATESTVKDSPPPEPRSPDDRSLTLKQYIEAGVPAHDRKWSGDDMARAANVLAAISQKDAGNLPRYRSQRSGDAFERLSANDNLDRYRNPSLPIEQRLPDALNYMQSSSQIFNLYLVAFNQHAVGGGELTELTGTQLQVSAVMLTLVNEFLPTLDKDDPTYRVRMDGLKQMKKGLASVVAGSLQTLTESHAYRRSELKRLVGFMQSTFPKILPELPSGSRSEFLVRLRSFSDDPKMQYLKPELDQLVAAAETSTQPNAAP